MRLYSVLEWRFPGYPDMQLTMAHIANFKWKQERPLKAAGAEIAPPDYWALSFFNCAGSSKWNNCNEAGAPSGAPNRQPRTIRPKPLKGEGAEIVPLIYWVLCLSNYQNYCKTDDKCSHVDVICMCLLMYCPLSFCNPQPF